MGQSISFVTAARTGEEAEPLRRSLADVFHAEQPIEFELLVEVGHDSIFRAYGAGAARAEYETLCFVHTDVRLLCNHTCFEKPMDLVQKPLVAFVGVAGSLSLPKSGVWWEAPHTDLRGMVAHPSDDTFGLHYNHWPHGQAALFGDVAVLDGVFLMTTKKKLQKVGGFDAQTYGGFHFYDISVCMQACRSGFRNLVAPIPLLHLSPGRPNEEYQRNRGIFVSRFGAHLPFHI